MDSRNNAKPLTLAQRTKLKSISNEDREHLKEFILTTIDNKLRAILKTLVNEKNEPSDSDSGKTQISYGKFSELYEDLEHKNLSAREHIREDQKLNKSNENENLREVSVNTDGLSISPPESLNPEISDQFECPICYETLSVSESESLGCSHLLCKKCICQHLTTCIVGGKTDALECPEMGCNYKADDETVERLVTFKVYERYYELRLKKAIGKMNDIFYCPNVKCQAIVPCEIDVGLGVCGVCNFNFCTNCLKPYHGVMDCHLNEHEEREMLLRYQIQQESENEEIANKLRKAEEKRKEEEENKNRRLQQDKASESLIKTSFKRCPGCRADVEKHEGCNHMVCTACKSEFCWLCLEKFADKAHMKTHFNSKCVLFHYDFVD